MPGKATDQRSTVRHHMFPERGSRRPHEILGALFVDPGIKGTGWAWFPRMSTLPAGPVARAQQHGVFWPPKTLQWEGKVDAVCSWMAGVCSALGPRVAILEFPGLWGGSALSQMAAAGGDLFKLAYLVGGLAEVCRQHGTCHPALISPAAWKGQLPKEVVMERVLRAWPYLAEGGGLRDHETDALGMGLAAQGGL